MVTFAFGIHNHQSLDSPDSVIEAHYREAYKPFLDVLREFETIRVSFHVSGALLEWLQEHHPAHWKKLRRSLALQDSELANWQHVIDHIFIPWDPHTNILCVLRVRIYSMCAVTPGMGFTAPRQVACGRQWYLALPV